MELVREKSKPKKPKKKADLASNTEDKQDINTGYLPPKMVTSLQESKEKVIKDTNEELEIQQEGNFPGMRINKLDSGNKEDLSDQPHYNVTDESTKVLNLKETPPLQNMQELQMSNLKIIDVADSLQVFDDIESTSLKNNVVSKIKLSLDKVQHLSDDCNTSTGISTIKDVYPNLKTIQHCEKREEIESLQALVRTYTDVYTNTTYNEANKKYQEFQKIVTGIENCPLFDLIKEYQNARKLSSEAHARMKYLNSKLSIEKNNLWKLVKKDISSKGRCDDGYSVTISHGYYVKELDTTKFNEVIEILRELEQVILSDAFYSYSDQLSKLKIDQHIYNIISCNENSNNQTNDDGSLFKKVDTLKKCISILFQCQRQSIKDKAFIGINQKWLIIMVSKLLQNGNPSEFLFIVNHVIRCPGGIQSWASQLIQLPGYAMCLKRGKDDFICQCLYHTLLVLYLILNPAPDRDVFLKNVKSSFSRTSSDGKFTMLDSDGEEEEIFEVVRDWSNDDIISLVQQISIAKMYEHLLIEKKDAASSRFPSKDSILRVFAFSTAMVNILFTGFGNYSSEDFATSIECICSVIRHVVCYVSDHWITCMTIDMPSKSALQAEYDRFIFHIVFHIFHYQKLGVWKFLSSLPYKSVSKKMIWNILWIFHSPKFFEESVYLVKDVDLKLQDRNTISLFIEKLKTIDQCDQIYLLNAYKSFVLCGHQEEELLCFIVHEIFEVTFVETCLNHLSKESTDILVCIFKMHPAILSALLKEIEKNEDEAINLSSCMVEELDLTLWKPSPADIRMITTWLLDTPLSSPKNYVSRILLTKMNWDFCPQGELNLPIALHREIAVVVLQAYMKFDNSGNKWSVSRGLSQMFQFATLRTYAREDEGFVSWAWDLLFTLKLHALDKKCPPWPQIYDGFLDVDFLPDPFEEVWLQPLLLGYEEKHPVACYLFLVMTNIGHDFRRLLKEGLQCLSGLIDHQQYLATIQSLYYMLPFFVKNSDELLCQSQFITVVSDLIIADMSVLSNISSGAVVGAVLHKMSAMIKHQVSEPSSLTVEYASPILKLWINILLKVLSIQETRNYNLKDSATQVHYLLDVIVKMSFLDSYTRTNMVDLLYSLGNPLLTSDVNIQSSFWSKMFSSNVESYTILKKQTLPEYPWLAWFVLRCEIKQKHVQSLWYQVQKELSKHPDIQPLAALKKACTFLKVTVPALESLPIYRWGLQIVATPISHPVQALLWQQFFHYYFERISISDSSLPKSPALHYFKSGAHLQFLKNLKRKAQETAEYYRKHLKPLDTIAEPKNKDHCVNPSNVVTVEHVLDFELCRTFRAFSVWIDDKSLHQPNLCLSALDPSYCSERLRLILNNDQGDWFELVSVDGLKDDLDQKIHSWLRKRNSFDRVSNIIVLECQSETLHEKFTRHSNNETIKPLTYDVNIDSPIKKIDDVALTSWDVLVQLIESNQRIIFDNARSFTDLANKLKQSNFNYKNWVPEEFINEDHTECRTKTCSKGSGCNGPATFNLQVKRYITNQRVREKLESNRIEHHIIQDQLLNLPVSQLCYASVHIENYISAISKKLKSSTGEEEIKLMNLGISLFYHQIQAVNEVITSVKCYTPSRNFFSTSIEALGNVFICDQEHQLCSLATAILNYPEAGELAFDLFNPNIASLKVFLELYKNILSSIMKGSSNAIFVLLNKIDFQNILKTKGFSFLDRREIFKSICKALLECGSSPPKDVQMVYCVIRDHFRTVLLLTFPELYDDTVEFIMKGMELNKMSTDLWYDILHCFGCSSLNSGSSVVEIENALKKFVGNLMLAPDQQLFVSSQPININEVIKTMDMLHNTFQKKRSINLYKAYEMHIKPFGIFIALLSNSMLGALNENLTQVLNIPQLWKSLHLCFYAWLHPIRKEESFIFPWSDDQINNAKFMFQMFTICLKNIHDKYLGHNYEKCILSYTWSSYVSIYVTLGLRHYSVCLCHSELLNLPWEEFYPDSEDLEGMCSVLQSDLPESREFLAKISLQIPWIEVMKTISATKSPDYIRRTLRTLGKLLIVSGLDVSLTKSNLHQNNLKALEELAWHYLSVEDALDLLQLYYTTTDPLNWFKDELQNNHDVYILQFLKIVCCMTASLNSTDQNNSNQKRFLYIHNYTKALTSCLSTKNESALKILAKSQNILPALLTDIEKVIASVIIPDQQMSNALPLIREAIGFLNNISDSKLESTLLHSMLSWLRSNPRSPLLLPCLQVTCRCLNQMTNVVIIMECCIVTRFNTDLYNPSDVQSIWQLILNRFQVPTCMTEEFTHACVNKNTLLTLYCHVLIKMPQAATTESKRLLLLSLIDWIKRCEIKEEDEAKCLLLWDKILELSIMLACEDNHQVVKGALSTFCHEISVLGEDKSSDGFLGAVGLGRSSNLSVNFRFICRTVVAFLLLQMPSNAAIRLQPMDPGYFHANEIKNNLDISFKSTGPSPSPTALKALENVKVLLKNKHYSALRDLISSAIEFVSDPKHSLIDSRLLLKNYVHHVFPKQSYLHSLG